MHIVLFDHDFEYKDGLLAVYWRQELINKVYGNIRRIAEFLRTTCLEEAQDLYDEEEFPVFEKEFLIWIENNEKNETASQSTPYDSSHRIITSNGNNCDTNCIRH